MAAKKGMAKLDPTTSESLGDDAYEWLIAAITSFRIPTNSQISENKLAAELGVSRTPVREALKRLETEGIVKRGEAGRFTVAMLTSKDVDEAIVVMGRLSWRACQYYLIIHYPRHHSIGRSDPSFNERTYFM